MSNVRRLGGGSPSPAPANTYQPTGTAPPVTSQHNAASPPPAAASRPAAQPVPSGMRAPAYAGSAALPPADASVDTSRVGQDGGGFEKRDDAYWQAHPLAPGTYDLDVYVNKIADWSVGRVAITLQVHDWDPNIGAKGGYGPHHQRPIDWDHSRPDLVAKLRTATHAANSECKCDGCKAYRGLQYWRAEMVGAYAAAGIAEAQFPMLNGNAVIPWWSLFFHQCPDGVMVPVMLSATIAVQAGRQRFPTIRAIRRIESENGKPVQAPMPYAVPPYFAADMRWTIAEEKVWGKSDGFNGTAQVAILDRNAVPLGHCNLPTYKDL
jgi:hypothetical protein